MFLIILINIYNEVAVIDNFNTLKEAEEKAEEYMPALDIKRIEICVKVHTYQ